MKILDSIRTPFLLAALWLATGIVPAQELTESDREALREELQQARTELNEAARRLSEIQRQLASGDAPSVFVWQTDESGDGQHIERHIERVIGTPGSTSPRLGVLLGAGSEDDPRTVLGVTPGSGAEAAGIRSGDVLVKINEQPIPADAPERIREVLEGLEAGTSIPVELRRGDQELVLGVELSSPGEDVRMIIRRFGRGDGEIPVLLNEDIRSIVDSVGMGEFPRPPAPPGFQGLGLPHFGALGRDIDLVGNHAGLAGYFGTGDGVLVLRVAEDNAFGLEAGDVILSVQREAVASPVALGRQLISLDSDSEVVLEVMRAGVMIELRGRLPERERLGLRVPGSRTSIAMRPAAPAAPMAPAAPGAPPIHY